MVSWQHVLVQRDRTNSAVSLASSVRVRVVFETRITNIKHHQQLIHRDRAQRLLLGHTQMLNHDRWTIWKLGNQLQRSTHSFHVMPQR